jgi:hypothetical protein
MVAFADFVKETTSTTGTGTYQLGGAVSGRATFVAGVGSGETVYYAATSDADWEVGSGVVTSGSPDTLTRASILASSNSNNAVNWSAGTKQIYLVAPALFFTKAVLDDAVQTLTAKTLGNYTETVFAVTDGSTVNLDPNNGPIQTWTLGASRTPGQANWAAGQSITLLIDDGSAHTITWTTLAVVWKTDGGTAPTLETSGFTVIVLWKVGTTIYGARVGDA